MEVLSIVCLKTNQLVYSYTCEDENYLSIAEYRANKRFTLDQYRFTTSSDYDHSFNRDLYIGYEVVGTTHDSGSPSEYAGQTGY